MISGQKGETHTAASKSGKLIKWIFDFVGNEFYLAEHIAGSHYTERKTAQKNGRVYKAKFPTPKGKLPFNSLCVCLSLLFQQIFTILSGTKRFFYVFHKFAQQQQQRKKRTKQLFFHVIILLLYFYLTLPRHLWRRMKHRTTLANDRKHKKML